MTSIHNMLSEYDRLYNEATAVHGEHCILLMQVGSFWELYWYYDDDAQENNTDGAESARFAVTVMGLTVTRNTKKEPVSLKNPYMSGFPMAGPEKWNLLLDVGWTVVLARQVVDENAVIMRKLSESMSPSMRTDAVNTEHGNFACCVYVNERKSKCDVGVALIDVSTGCSVAIDVLKGRLVDCVSIVAPVIACRTVSEVILIGSEVKAGGLCQLLSSTWKHGTYVHDQIDKWDKEAVCSAYGDNILHVAFGENASRKTLHLCDRKYACDALVYLLHFTRQHMVRMSTHLPPPEILEPSGFVNFSMYAVQQLGVPKLLSIINRTVTPMGRRLFQARVLAPSCMAKDIRARLDAVSNVLQKDASHDHVTGVRTALKSVGDVHKWARKARQNDIALSMADTFQDVLDSVVDIAVTLDAPYIENICKTWVSSIEGVCVGDDSDLMFPGLQSATSLSAAMSEKKAEIESIRKGVHPDAKLIDRDRLEVTVVRWATVSDAVKARVVAVQLKNRMRVSDPELCVAWDEYTALEKELCMVQSSEWSKIIESGDFDGLNTVADWLANVDVTYTAAVLARSGVACKPTVLEGEIAMLQASSLGNIMAETALQNYSSEEYVRNDVSLDDETGHILLYGINSSGKSTILRGVGLAVIMVQAGLYAPCRSMTLCPFRRIDTRILTPDNVEKGLSSFTAEVHEMREALRAAGPKSLLLADELCNSTEHKSATALVGVLIKSVGEKGTKTFITTHFHELLDHPNLRDLSTLRVQHMSMKTDPVHGLIYERQLLPGPCEPDYGVLVAASLGFDAKFIREATQAREALCTSAAPKVMKSRYNKKVILNVCELCKSAPAQETHHIKHRVHAVGGMHGDVSENARSNLMPLCNDCHKLVHKEESTLVRVHTLNGPLIIRS